MKRVVQFSVDIVYEDGYKPLCSQIEKILSDAGLKVAGSDYQEDLTELYKRDYPECLED